MADHENRYVGSFDDPFGSDMVRLIDLPELNYMIHLSDQHLINSTSAESDVVAVGLSMDWGMVIMTYIGI